MEPWQEANVMARRIEAGDFDKYLHQLQVALHRRDAAIRAKRDLQLVSGPLARQRPVVFNIGDLVKVSRLATYRMADQVCEVVRISEKTAFVRPLPGYDDGVYCKATTFQRTRGHRVQLSHLTPHIGPRAQT